jgi:S-DNA-T family DNA segregation ATPase FtsK/SpoIIIE
LSLALPKFSAFSRTTTDPAAAPPRALWKQRVGALVGLVVWTGVALALATHHASDPGFTTSGDGGPVLNLLGRPGAWLSDVLLAALGASVSWLPLVGLLQALRSLARGARADDDAPAPRWPRLRFWGGLVLLLCASTALEWTRLYGYETRVPGGHSGGVLGFLLGPLSMQHLGFLGSGVLWIAALVLGMAGALRFSWVHLADGIGGWIDGRREHRAVARERAEDERIGEIALRERELQADEIRIEDVLHAPIVIEPEIVQVVESKRVQRERQKPLFVELHDNKLPQVDLLDAAPTRIEQTVTPESLEMTSRMIEKKLGDFGVEVRVVAAAPGPVITRYEIEPATGVKGSQIVNLAKDLARSLSLVSIRVVETIPGKTTMALELPNARRQMIKLSEILGSNVYNEASSMLTIALGKDIVGKMPHCLVAGTTGSGKSVGINAMILSLLYKAEDKDVRLILIDPKMLEMSVYEDIPHLLCPVVTDMKQAGNALSWCVNEMERRYKLMSKMGVRNLAGYNKKIDDAKERGELLPNPFSPEPQQRLPFIVVVIDELADLMMVVGKKVEELIARLAQKARAAGIHLVLATQRPSVDVITGLIKANIPTRLSFQVSSKIDSRTILDQMGAEALLGQGDMLYLTPGGGVPVRVHGAFVSDDEVHRVVEYLKSRSPANYIEGILEGGVLEGDVDGDGSGGGSADAEADPLYDQAVAVVLQNKRASISLVQRHLRIGYNRAARLLEQMEQSGLVSSMSGSGNREILVPKRDE